MKTSAILLLKPTEAVRSSSPAKLRLKSTPPLPGSPIPSNTRAKGSLKPRCGMRASSPARTALKPIDAVPGSLITNTCANAVVKSRHALRASGVGDPFTEIVGALPFDDTRARAGLKPNLNMRAWSPAKIAVKSRPQLPGSPIRDTRAMTGMKPRRGLRASGVGGSFIGAVGALPFTLEA
jgi:hypothetical protein